METAHCARCGRPSPEPAGEWEAVDSAGDEVVCDSCLTPVEQQAITEDWMEMANTTPLEDPSDPRGDPL